MEPPGSVRQEGMRRVTAGKTFGGAGGGGVALSASSRCVAAAKLVSQCAFALSPIPAYLPQYWALCREEPHRRPSCAPHARIKRSPSPTRHRSAPPAADSRHFYKSSLTDVAERDAASARLDAASGFSPFTVLVLILAHLLRLLYFYGLIVALPPTIHADAAQRTPIQYDLILQSITMIGMQFLFVHAMARRRRIEHKRRLEDSHYNNNNNNNDNNEKDLSAGGGNADSTHFFTMEESHDCPPSSLDDVGDNNSANKRATATSTVVRPSSDRETNMPHSKTYHHSYHPLSWLYRPSQIWQWQSFRSHVEFLVFLSLSVFFLVDRYLYQQTTTTLQPQQHTHHSSLGMEAGEDRRIEGVNLIRNLSVLLESCLALPQLVQNHRRRDTDGLSLLMVVGWILGDFMKLIYFTLLSSPTAVVHNMAGESMSGVLTTGGDVIETPFRVANEPLNRVGPSSSSLSSGGIPSSSDYGSNGGGMEVFAWGCLLALTLDFLVGLQMILWYPTPEVLTVRRSIRRKIQHIATDHVKDSGSVNSG